MNGRCRYARIRAWLNAFKACIIFEAGPCFDMVASPPASSTRQSFDLSLQKTGRLIWVSRRGFSPLPHGRYLCGDEDCPWSVDRIAVHPIAIAQRQAAGKQLRNRASRAEVGPAAVVETLPVHTRRPLQPATSLRRSHLMQSAQRHGRRLGSVALGPS